MTNANMRNYDLMKLGENQVNMNNTKNFFNKYVKKEEEDRLVIVVDPDRTWSLTRDSMNNLKRNITTMSPGNGNSFQTELSNVIQNTINTIYDMQATNYKIFPKDKCILIMYLRSKSAQGIPAGQSLHRNVQTMTYNNKEYKSLTQTLIYVDDPKSNNGTNILPNKTPSTYYIPKFKKIQNTYFKTPIPSSLVEKIKIGTSLNTLKRNYPNVNVARFKARKGMAVQWISFYGYHQVQSKTPTGGNLPAQTRQMILTHLLAPKEVVLRNLKNITNKNQAKKANPTKYKGPGSYTPAAIIKGLMNGTNGGVNRTIANNPELFAKQVEKLSNYGFKLSDNLTKYKYKNNNAKIVPPGLIEREIKFLANPAAHFTTYYKNDVTKNVVGRGGQGSIFKARDPLYVWKIIPFVWPGKSNAVVKKAFEKEVEIGKKLGQIGNSKIFGNFYGAYKMKNYKNSMTLNEYIDAYWTRYKQIPGVGHPVYKKLINKIKKLYKLGYYHGDLHGANILVITNNNNNNVEDVVLIDFGLGFNRKNRNDPFTLRLGNLWKKMRAQEGNNKKGQYTANNTGWFRKLNNNALVQRGQGRNIEFKKRLVQTNNNNMNTSRI